MVLIQEPDEETLGFFSGSLEESYYFGVIGSGSLNQVPPTLVGSRRVWSLRQEVKATSRSPQL